MNNILIDTCFWLALWDCKDEHHTKAVTLAEYLEFNKILIPWPSLYETLNTKFIRKRRHLELNKFLKNFDYERCHDQIYRDSILDVFLEDESFSTHSLVDLVICEMIKDSSLQVKHLISFNPCDFYKVCYEHNVELISS